MKTSVQYLSLLILLFALSCSKPEPDLPPNVLFITSDDLNNDLGLYGHDLVHSPNLNALASTSLVFDRAYCQYPVCNPSRSSFMTGLYPEQTGILSNAGHFREHIPNVKTLPQWFKENGYISARIGKLYHYQVPLGIGTPGRDDSISWDITINPKGIDLDSLDLVNTIVPGRYGGTLSWLNINSRDDEHTDGKIALSAINLLKDLNPKSSGKPFFLGLGFYRPHTPYVAPSEYFDLYPIENIEPLLEVEGDRENKPAAALFDRKGQRALTVDQRKEIIQAYYASITFMDKQLGLVLEELDRLGLRDNTIIVFLSDHGYHLGQHGMWQKSDLFEGSVRVPLLVSAPGQNSGMHSQALVELVDLFPTLIELAEITDPGHLKGKSLIPLFESPDQNWQESAFSVTRSRGVFDRKDGDEHVLGHTIRTDRYRYTEWGRGKYGKELYDYKSDPMEYNNLAGLSSSTLLQDSLAKMLDLKVQYAR